MKNLQNSYGTHAELLPIGAMAKRSGFAVSAIRYYEEIGLLPAAIRRESGHRVYPESVLEVLALIRHCRDLGFSIEETHNLVELSTSQERDCTEALTIAQTHLATVRAKMDELRRLERSLSQYVSACDQGCAGGAAPDCVILLTGLRDEKIPGTATATAGCCSSQTAITC